GHRQIKSDPELRAFVGDAVDTDLAAHLFDQALGDDQPQASAASAAGGGVVGLAESLEQGPHLLFGQADSAVAHADAQLRAVVLLVFEHGADDDAAAVRELDGVADQV